MFPPSPTEKARQERALDELLPFLDELVTAGHTNIRPPREFRQELEDWGWAQPTPYGDDWWAGENLGAIDWLVQARVSALLD